MGRYDKLRHDTWMLKRMSQERLNEMCDWCEERDKRAEKFVRELCNPEKLAPMYNWIRETLQLPEMQFTAKVVNGSKDTDVPTIEFESNNIVNCSPILEAAFSSFKVENFNSNCFREKFREEDTVEYGEKIPATDCSKPAKIYYWFTVDYRYHVLQGGSNGVHIATVTIDEQFNVEITSELTLAKQREEEEREWRSRYDSK